MYHVFVVRVFVVVNPSDFVDIKRKKVVNVFINIIFYFFLLLREGEILAFLQSDWLQQRAEFSTTVRNRIINLKLLALLIFLKFYNSRFY